MTEIYLAGPFFNDAQNEAISKLEIVLEKDYKVYSPRRDGIVLEPNSPREALEQVFEENVTSIRRCDILIAQVASLDNRPEMIMLAAMQDVLKEFKMEVEDHLEMLQGIMAKWAPRLPNYTDLGTVWELGCAWALGKPVILFSPTNQTRINVMLTEGARVTVQESTEELLKVIPRVLDGETIPWMGETR